MRQLFFIFLVMLGSVSFSHYLLKDPGYILIQFLSWRVESSFIVMVLAISIIFLALFLSLKIISSILKAPFFLTHVFQAWCKKRQEKRFKQGINAFFKGEWKLALEKLKHKPKRSSWPLDLISAQAAQNQGLIKERDQFLQTAALEAPKERQTILMFQAQLQIAKGQFEQAQATLTHIRHHAKSLSPQWYFLQTEIELHFQNYQQALDMLVTNPMLKRELTSYNHLFKQSILGLGKINALPDSKTFLQLLKNQNQNLQDDQEILSNLASMIKDDQNARKWLLKKLNTGLKQKPLNLQLLPLLSQMELDTKSFQKYEALLSEQAPSPEIYVTLATMKIKQSLWGSALNDLNHAIKINPSKKAYLLMAEIYLSINQNSNALEAMQHALKYA